MCSFSTLNAIIIVIISLVSAIKCVESPLSSPPSIVREPPNQLLYHIAADHRDRIRPFVLECEAKGDPEPTYRWIKNGLEFNYYLAYNKRIIQKPRKGTLIFTKPHSIDEGLYQCLAENKHGVSVSNAVFVRKLEINSFADEEVRDVLISEGDPFTLDCNPPTGYPNPSVFLLIMANTGESRIVNSSRITVDPEGRVHFSNVTLQDMFDDSKYTCLATNRHLFKIQYKIGGKTNIRVMRSGISSQWNHSPILQYVSPKSVSALRYQKLELHCIFGGTPLPDIVWNKRNGSLKGSVFFKNYGKTLVINKVDFSDEGVYECTASNGFGRNRSHEIEVKVNSSPFWIQSPNNTNATEGQTVSFKCNASGIPEPKLQWFVNGIPIEKASPNPRRRVEGNTLIINDVMERVDTSVFQCNASNIYGYAFRDFFLNVLKADSSGQYDTPSETQETSLKPDQINYHYNSTDFGILASWFNAMNLSTSLYISL